MALFLLLSTLTALPLSSAFGVVVPSQQRFVSSRSSSSLFTSTMELAPAVDVFSDFPSLDDMEQEPSVEDDQSLFEEVNSKKKKSQLLSSTSIQVTDISNANDSSLSSSTKTTTRPSIESTSSPRASVQASTLSSSEQQQQHDYDDDTTMSATAHSLLSSPRKRLLQENNSGQTQRRVTAKVRETGYDSMRNYMKTMCNHELLNKNEEVILAREIQILMQWEASREELEAKLLR